MFLKHKHLLQYPNKQIKKLVDTIVKPSDRPDIKARKILFWVQENFKYVSDKENYNRDEYWAIPTMSIKRLKGDCEDGAFLIHSMMLNAGIDPKRIRTYGGAVKINSKTAPFGGHGWTAFKRAKDGKWVALDWCYYPNWKGIAKRQPLSKNMKYMDDWFFIDINGFHDARRKNYIR
jgi:hypothetical protein